MRSLSILLTALSAASLTLAAPAPSPDTAIDALDLVAKDSMTLEKRATATMIMYKDANYKGQALILYGTGAQCYNLPADFNDSVTSLVVAKGYTCVIYSDALCRGSYRVYGNPDNLQDDNLATSGFNDVTSSYGCYKRG